MRSAFRLVAVALVLAACSSGGSPAATTTVSSAPSTTIATASSGWPRVDLIDAAISALETKLDGPQQYFEINATAQLVNLFVALNDGKVAQAWVYVDGELSSSEGQGASGHTFTRDAVDFDPATVLTQVQSQLADSRPDVFFIEGGENGAVRYSVALTSQEGGQLVVIVGPDGKVLSVET